MTELSWKSEVCCLLFGNFELSAVSQGDLGETEREIGKLARRVQGDIEIHDGQGFKGPKHNWKALKVLVRKNEFREKT